MLWAYKSDSCLSTGKRESTSIIQFEGRGVSIEILLEMYIGTCRCVWKKKVGWWSSAVSVPVGNNLWCEIYLLSFFLALFSSFPTGYTR